MIDERSILDIVLGVCMAAVGYMTKRQVTRIDNLQSDLEAHKLYIAEKFAPREEIEKRFDKVDLRLDKADAKQDAVLELLRTIANRINN